MKPPVVVLAKGQSARHIPPGDYHVAACSEAVRLCDRADWLAVTDLPALEALAEQDVAKARRLLLPRMVHLDAKPSGLVPWDRAIRSTAARVLQPSQIHLFCLHTDPDPNPALRHFGRCRSVSDAAIAYLLSAGYREFYTSGIETDGAGGYHPVFDRQAPKSTRHRQSIWQHTLRRIEAAGATVERWETAALAQSGIEP